jgi:membrane protein
MAEPFYRRAARLVGSLLHADLSSLSRGKRSIAYSAQVVREAAREMVGSSCLMRSSALAFSTLLALVPLVVVVSGVTAGLFPEQSDQILDRVASLLVPARDINQNPVPEASSGMDSGASWDQRDVLVSARAALRKQLGGIQTHAREVNIIGFFVLLYAVLSLLDSIEQSLNAIWHVRKGRGWLEKLPYYSAILFLAPIFMMLSISLTTTLQAIGASAANSWLVPGWARGAPGFLLKHVTPVFLMAIALWVTYIWMPTAKVRRLPALGAAIVAATGLEIMKQMFLVGAISVVRTNKIYGSLAVLPILFLWLYLSWVIVLSGTAVAFVVQNFDDLTRKAERLRRALECRVYYALRIVLEVARRFREGANPRVVPDLVRAFDLPEYLVSGLCADLVERRVLTAVAGDPEGFVPAKSLRTLTAADVVHAAGEADLGAPQADDSSEHQALAALLGRLAQARQEASQLSVAELLDRSERAAV